MQSTFGNQRVAWLKLENFVKNLYNVLNLDSADLDSHDPFFVRPGGAFCYCSASMRAFMAT